MKSNNLYICDSCSFELFPLAHQQRTEVIKLGGVELPLIAGIVKRLVHRYRYADGGCISAPLAATDRTRQ